MMPFKKISAPYIFFAAAVAGMLLSAIQSCAQNQASLAGYWRGEFTIRENIKAPFNFEIKADSSVVLINGEERFETGRFWAKRDSVFIPLDQFDNELAFRVTNKGMSGVLRKQDHTGVSTPVTAEKSRERFRKTGEPALNMSGTYEVQFQFESGKKEKAVAVFTQEGNKLAGTFLKPSGDTRFLEGIVVGNRFYLSSFIGSSPGYYEGAVTREGKISGFQAGTKIKHLFSGKSNSSATLNDPYSVTSVSKGDSTITFNLPDVNGKMVSLQDEKYRNKVVIIAITGTWCPNCVDEAAFLSPWYNKNKERGVEIITIHFERQADTAFTRKVMNRFRNRFKIEYDQVFGGLSNADSVPKVIKGLDSFRSFPTTIFIDKKGKVSKIHAGYTGPATGKFYDEFVEEFNKEVDRLLSK